MKHRAGRLRGASVIALVIVAVAAGVRFYRLGARSFDALEIAYIDAADKQPASLGTDRLQAAAVSGGPLPRLITGLALRYGYDECTVRIAGAFAGTLTVLVLWRLGRTLFADEAALYAISLLAISPLHVARSRAVGFDVWVALLAVLAALMFHRAIQDPRCLWRWAAFVATATMTCLSGYAGLLMLLVFAAGVIVLAARGCLTAGVLGRALLAIVLAGVVPLGWTVHSPPHVAASFFYVRPGWPLLQQMVELATGLPGGYVPALMLLACSVGGVCWGGRVQSWTPLVALWAVMGTAGVVIADWRMTAAFRTGEVTFALPAILLLAGVGLRGLRRIASGVLPRPFAYAGALAILLVVEVPGLVDEFRQQPPLWRETATLVAANAGPSDSIVVLRDRQTFVFYAPALERRVLPNLRPEFAPGRLRQAARGWLVVPLAAELYPGWGALARWLPHRLPINLSPGPDLDVWYVGNGTRDQQWHEAASFTLPTATLVRGRLLLDFLLHAGPVDPVLWKVDQIALSRDIESYRNPDLLNAVYYLAEHGHSDRAASLAYRLATAEPGWTEAQQALAAFRSEARPAETPPFSPSETRF